MKTITELISFLETCENQKQLQIETHTILKLCKEIQAKQFLLCNVSCSLPADYKPNGTKEDINIGILHSVNGYWVSNEGTKSKPNYHVWKPSVNHSIVDSAYKDISLAVARCNYLANTHEL